MTARSLPSFGKETLKGRRYAPGRVGIRAGIGRDVQVVVLVVPLGEAWSEERARDKDGGKYRHLGSSLHVLFFLVCVCWG